MIQVCLCYQTYFKCICITDGLWYRAMCLEDRPSNEYNIIFLDFGNMARVDKTNIRRMVPDYVKIPAVAILCLLEGKLFLSFSFFLCASGEHNHRHLSSHH